MISRHFFAVLGLSLLTTAGASRAENWPRFRGPNGSGISADPNIPTRWTDADLAWKVELPGTGHSSPVVWGDRLLVTAADEKAGRLSLVCLKTTDGSQVWRTDFKDPPHHHHQFNSLAAVTPSVDDQRIYLSWTGPEHYNVVALDHDGHTLWTRDLGPFKAEHGGGASPTIAGGTLLVNDEQDGPSALYGLDPATGAVKWKLPRTHRRTSYSTPCLLEGKNGGPPLAVFCSLASGMTAVDPATGKVAWELPGVFPLRTVMSPSVAGGLIVETCGEGGGGKLMVAVQPPDASGGPARVVWKLEKTIPYVPMPVAHKGLLFYVTDGGIAVCLDNATGKVRWQERLGGAYFASPVCIGEAIYCVNRGGDVVVFRATGEKLDVLFRGSVGEETHATPAVANGRIFFRTLGHVICVAGKTQTAMK